MPLETVTPSPYGLTDVETLRDYLSGGDPAKLMDATKDGILAMLVNQATGVVERRTRRKLRARAHLPSVTVATVTTTINSAVVTAASFPAGVRAHMEVTGTGIAAGTLVKTRDSSTQLTLTKPATATGTPTLTFAGVAATFKLDGLGSSRLSVTDWPVVDLRAAAYVDDATGTTTAIDIDEWRNELGGVLYLPQDGFPRGVRNINLDIIMGYERPAHDSELDALEYASLRLAQVMWQDRSERTGRGTGFSVAGASINLIPDAMPKDVDEVVKEFQRIW